MFIIFTMIQQLQLFHTHMQSHTTSERSEKPDPANLVAENLGNRKTETNTHVGAINPFNIILCKHLLSNLLILRAGDSNAFFRKTAKAFLYGETSRYWGKTLSTLEKVHDFFRPLLFLQTQHW